MVRFLHGWNVTRGSRRLDLGRLADSGCNGYTVGLFVICVFVFVLIVGHNGARLMHKGRATWSVGLAMFLRLFDLVRSS